MSGLVAQQTALFLQLLPMVHAEFEEAVERATADVAGSDSRAGRGQNAPLAVQKRDDVHKSVNKESLSAAARLK